LTLAHDALGRNDEFANPKLRCSRNEEQDREHHADEDRILNADEDCGERGRGDEGRIEP